MRLVVLANFKFLFLKEEQHYTVSLSFEFIRNSRDQVEPSWHLQTQ